VETRGLAVNEDKVLVSLFDSTLLAPIRLHRRYHFFATQPRFIVFTTDATFYAFVTFHISKYPIIFIKRHG
jgi:hypothetical protein